MTRMLTAVGASLGVLLAAGAAHAQPHDTFGQQGQFIIGADRLFSLFSYTHIAQDQFNPGPGNSKQTTTVNGTALSLLWGSSPVIANGGVPIISPFAVPRIGVDYVIVPHVTIGGDLIVFFTLGGNTATDTTTNGGTTSSTSTDNPGQFLFGIEPRGGYILPLTDMFSLWLRGGLSYYIQSSKTTAGGSTTTNTTNQLALDLEPQVVFTPIPHVGFTAGLTGDIPLTGGHSTDVNTNGRDTSQSAWSGILFVGVTLGMLAHF
ncbi:MAG TPA: hypothetical protein VE987_22830 [Polyangiaceae bacterium]|nr:hypothetical protein [Polyangiaceae bacterium]